LLKDYSVNELSMFRINLLKGHHNLYLPVLVRCWQKLLKRRCTYQKKSGCKHFITRFYIEKNEPERFTANKIYGKYRTGNDFFGSIGEVLAEIA
jgi:hypothetical protein